MSTTFSIFHRWVGNLLKSSVPGQARTDSLLPHVGATGAVRPVRHGRARVVTKSSRLQEQRQVQGEATQTPSNLM